MIATYRCPDCHATWTRDLPEGVELDEQFLTQACPVCHERRRARINEIESRYPSATSLGMLGSTGPSPLLYQLRSRGRRVMRKGEIYGG